MAAMCRVLRVSTSGFYAWLSRGERERSARERSLIERIVEIHRRSGSTYGSMCYRAWRAMFCHDRVPGTTMRVPPRACVAAGPEQRAAEQRRVKSDTSANKSLDTPAEDGYSQAASAGCFSFFWEPVCHRLVAHQVERMRRE